MKSTSYYTLELNGFLRVKDMAKTKISNTRTVNYPESSKNVRARTAFAKQELSCLRSVFERTFGEQEGFNEAIALAQKDAITENGTVFSLDYSKLTISMGALVPITGIEMKIINANSVRMSWNTDLLHGASPNDMISWVFLFPDTKNVIHRLNCISRDAGSINLELPFKKTNHSLHCWAYLSLHNTYLFSPASYLQITDLQSKLTDKK